MKTEYKVHMVHQWFGPTGPKGVVIMYPLR